MEQDNINPDDQTPYQSPTFGKDGSFHVDEAVGSASISPSGRDVVLASREGLHIIDLDNPYSPPRHLPHRTPWEVADVQWSPFAWRDYWVVSTSNQKALVWNLEMSTTQAPIQYVLHAHSRAITDINFSAHDPNKLATCAVDSFVHCWDFRQPNRPAISFADWYAGATQVKWNRQDPHIIASSHDRSLHVWDERKGSTPLRTINAHSTKIYGIDWNRTESTHILTCSLDKTIKLWDYSIPGEEPTRKIQTSYPIWRARHTPFGMGILAMPQRGTHELYLYDRRLDGEGVDDKEGIAQPVHSFRGHRDQVKEFLWRTQGAVDDGIDNRSFQLVSWSTDRNLLLHRLDDPILESVGYKKGKEANKKLSFTRKGATYKSFHDQDSQNKPEKPTGHGLSNMFRNEARTGMRKAPIPILGLEGRSLQPAAGFGMRVRSGPPNKDADPITWMKGVRIGDSIAGRTSGTQRFSSNIPPWERPENLGDEITFAGEMFKNVSFEKVDVSGRFVVLSLSGPWGANDSLVYLKASIRFPNDYPEHSPPRVKIERTSSISDAAFTRLGVELRVLCEAYSSVGRGCLEAVLKYLLGDNKLEEITLWITESQNRMSASAERNAADSSSDEDDAVMGNFNVMPGQDLETSVTDVLDTTTANANVPLPKACGALWADDGRLVCFFAPKIAEQSMIAKVEAADGDKRPRSANRFESFGRLRSVTLKSNKTINSKEDDLSTFSDTSSSFSSSSDSTESNDPMRPLTAVWSRRDFRIGRDKSGLENSIDHGSVSRNVPHRNLNTSNQFISLHNFSDILPSKRVLAEDYQIYGGGPEVCTHNAQVAKRYGLHDTADVWRLLSLILCDDVPLELLMQPEMEKDVLVLARRALVRIKRRDSGLDLAFDQPKAVVDSKLNGRVKWGGHPLAGAWMIDMLFEHFEQLGDVQMLAMLSCILHEDKGGNAITATPSSIRADTPLSQNPNPYNLFKKEASLPFVSKTPAISFEYFSSADTAMSLLQSRYPSSTNERPLQGPGTTFGSYPSSNGAWSSDGTETERVVHASDQSSPLLMTRQNSRTSNSGQGLSISPEQAMRRSSSTVSNVFATSFSKQFASFLTSASSSPPNQARTPELSTSAPTSGPSPSGITWGRTTVHWGDNSKIRRVDSGANTLYDLDDAPVIEEDTAIADDEDTVVQLKHQDMFDDEACLDMPLLNPAHEARHAAYREAYAHLLYIWGLPLVRCEVLKFNHSSIEPSRARRELVEDDAIPPHEKHTSSWAPRGQQGDDSAGLEVAVACWTCGESIPSGVSDETHCEQCETAQARPACSVCSEAVEGLYEPCLRCGHVAHLDCVTRMLEEEGGGQEDEECEAGCGCLCGEEVDGEVVPAETLASTDIQARVREELGGREWSRGGRYLNKAPTVGRRSGG